MSRVQKDEIRRRLLRGERVDLIEEMPSDIHKTDDFYKAVAEVVRMANYTTEGSWRRHGLFLDTEGYSYQLNPDHPRGALLLLLKGN